MDGPSAKRPRNDSFWPDNLWRDHSSVIFDSRLVQDCDDELPNVTLVGPDRPSLNTTTNYYSLDSTLSQRNRKRTLDIEDTFLDAPDPDYIFDISPDGAPSDLAAVFPTFQPSLPTANSRRVTRRISNPFDEVAPKRYISLGVKNQIPITGVAVDSYIKFRVVNPERQSAPSSPTYLPRQRGYSVDRRFSTSQSQSPTILSSPRGFGRRFILDELDDKLMKFYTLAMCSGRTLLPKTNGWLVDLAPMAESNEGMHHALLAFTAGYALDYTPNEKLRIRANYHYSRACKLLSERLGEASIHDPGNEDTVVGVLRLLWCDDIVQWELRRGREKLPRWFEAAQAAKLIMGNTDPGFRYWHARNVQCSSARTSNANMLAFVDICTLPVRPLNTKETESCHPWLLEGTEQESRRIYGGTGVCPKLLHMFGQITHLCAKMVDDPSSTMIPMGARAIERKLVNFTQWSELSNGHASPEDLLASCQLDENGLVTSATEVTELAGEAWVQAARIYLQCRFFRLSRDHPLVRQPLDLLIRIIKVMPCSGPLFTSQSPFFPVFIMGLVSSTEDDRNTARNWFEQVLSRAGARSSVPPIWRVTQQTWEWMDTELNTQIDDTHVDDKKIGERTAWWELLVERLMEREGILSLV